MSRKRWRDGCSRIDKTSAHFPSSQRVSTRHPTAKAAIGNKDNFESRRSLHPKMSTVRVILATPYLDAYVSLVGKFWFVPPFNTPHTYIHTSTVRESATLYVRTSGSPRDLETTLYSPLLGVKADDPYICSGYASCSLSSSPSL